MKDTFQFFYNVGGVFNLGDDVADVVLFDIYLMLIPLSLSQKRYNLLQLPILICHIL
jgi:hypothetical protein